MVVKTEIYFATRKTANAHVFIEKGVGKVRVNNVGTYVGRFHLKFLKLVKMIYD